MNLCIGVCYHICNPLYTWGYNDIFIYVSINICTKYIVITYFICVCINTHIPYTVYAHVFCIAIITNN